MADPGAAGDPRVFLAIERTFLAWTRTALAFIGFGFVVARLGLALQEFAGQDAVLRMASSSFPGSLLIGASLIALGAVIEVAALRVHRGRMARFRAGGPITAGSDAFASFVAVGICGAAIAIAIYLFSRLP